MREQKDAILGQVEPTPPAAAGRDEAVAAVAAGTTGRSLLSGGLWNGLNQLLPQLYTLVSSVVAARVLGASDMGRQSFIAWAGITVRTVVTGGMPVTLMRYVGESIGRGRPGVARALVGWALRLELLGGGAGALVMVGIGLGDPRLHNAWLLAGLGCLLTTLHAIPYSVLTGIQRWRQAATISLVLGAFATAGTVAALALGFGITGMFAVEAIVAGASLAWTSEAARRAFASVAPASEPDPDVRREFSRYATTASVLVLFEVIVWKRSEFFFMDHYSTAREIAQYSIAFAAATAITQLPQGMASVLSPAMASMFGAGELERARLGVSRAVRMAVLATLPIVAGAAAAGPALLRTVYGGDYRRSGFAFVVLMIGLPFVPLSSIGTSVVHGYGRVRLALAGIACAAVVDVALALTLIPRYGAPGAALANAGGQLVAGSLMLRFGARLVGGLAFDARTLARAAGAASIAGLAAWACVHAAGGVPGLAAAAVAGTATFAALLVVFRGVPEADARWLRDNVGDRLGGMVGRGASLFVRDAP